MNNASVASSTDLAVVIELTTAAVQVAAALDGLNPQALLAAPAEGQPTIAALMHRAPAVAPFAGHALVSGMSLGDAHRATEVISNMQQLLRLAALWTGYLTAARAVDSSEFPTLRRIVSEMLALGERMPRDVCWLADRLESIYA